MKPISQQFFPNWSSLIIALAFTGLVGLTPEGAGAKTPDGSPPSEEVVCDGQKGALYGLCNAYCEAMDCDSAAPHASATACAAVLDNFLRKSGGDLPPCEVQCPCWDEELLSTALQQSLAAGQTIVACTDQGAGGQQTFLSLDTPPPGHIGLFAQARFDSNICQLTQFDPNLPPLNNVALNLTEEEVAVCAEQILALCP